MGKSGIYVGTLGSSDTRLLVNSESHASFVQPGFLLFGRGELLMSQQFDPASLQLGGEPVPVGDAVARQNQWFATNYSSSDNGVLVYRPAVPVTTVPAWYDRHGKRLGAAGEPRRYVQFNLSPDEKRIATEITDPGVGTTDIWVLELASGILSRMTSDRASDDGAAWSPDGREIFYGSNRRERWNLYRKLVGGGDEQLIRELFYLSLDGTMMSVPITPGPPLEAGIPQVLFSTRVATQPTRDQFAATGNGQRFLVLEPTETGPRPFVVMLNWPAALKP